MSLSLKPNHATVKAYYETLHQFGQLYIDHEGAVRSPFQTLLAKCGQRATPNLTLVPEYRIERAHSSVIVDGARVDLYHLPHGYWGGRGRPPLRVNPSSTLSSRAEEDRSLANDPAQSRDLLSAGAESHSSTGKSAAQANSRSFDSVSRLASESAHFAQDDRVEVMSDLERFRAFVKAGQRLAEIHVHYEQQPEYALTKTEKAGEQLDYRVTKMRLTKDKTSLIYNQFLTLSEIATNTASATAPP